MSLVLLGWELGEHRGHVLRMRDIAAGLRSAGVSVAWAAVRVDQLKDIAQPGELVFQSPLWPSMHIEASRTDRTRRHISHADLLADLGLMQPGAFHGLILAWDAILGAVRPDAVFADYAPALLTACRGRIPTVASGIGFAVPPSHLKTFPRFPLPPTEGFEPDRDEALLLDEVNTALSRLGRSSLSHLPAIFGADTTVIASFEELDPFAPHRLERHAAPSLMNWAPPAREPGNEIIVYWSERALKVDAFFNALTQLELPVRVVAPAIRPEQIASHAPSGLRFGTTPLHFSEIARSARLVVSNGNTGFVSAALLAGLPQAVLSIDIQKALVGAAVERIGTGQSVALGTVDWPQWQSQMLALYRDADARVRAQAFAGKLIARMHAEPAPICVAALTRLAH